MNVTTTKTDWCWYVVVVTRIQWIKFQTKQRSDFPWFIPFLYPWKILKPEQKSLSVCCIYYPKTALNSFSSLYMQAASHIKRWSFFALALSLDWPWPMESSPSAVLGLLSPSLKRTGSFHMPPFGPAAMLWDTQAMWRDHMKEAWGTPVDSSRSTSTQVPVVWVGHLGCPSPIETSWLQQQSTSHGTKLSHWASHPTGSQEIINFCFKPLSFGLFYYTAINNQNSTYM